MMGEDELAEAIRREYLQAPPEEVAEHHLAELRAVALPRVDGPNRWKLGAAVMAAAASIALVAGAILVDLDESETTRLDATESATSTPMGPVQTTAGAPVTVAPADGRSALDGSTETGGSSTSDGAEAAPGSSTDRSTDPSIDSTGSTTGSPSSTADSTSGSTTTIAGSTTRSTTTGSPTTRSGTTSISNGSTATTSPTTRSSTTRPSTTSSSITTSSSLPAGPTIQERLRSAWVTMNTCLTPSGFVFVGLPGRSDAPELSDPAYRTAVTDCDRVAGIGQIHEDHERWSRGPSQSEKDEINTANRTVLSCVNARGWGVGDLQMGLHGVTFFSRYPAITPDRWLSFDTDLIDCGWYGLRLG